MGGIAGSEYEPAEKRLERISRILCGGTMYPELTVSFPLVTEGRTSRFHAIRSLVSGPAVIFS